MEEKLLVTGGSGLFGSKLIDLAKRENYTIYATYRQHKPLNAISCRVDISKRTEVKKIFDEIQPDFVVHAAALTNVDKCELEKKKAYKINAEGVKNVVEKCKKNKVFLVYISTDYVFDGEKGLYKEDDIPNPINYYGMTKLKGEEYVKSLDDSCIARTSSLFGTVSSRSKLDFFSWVLKKLKNDNEVRVITDQWISPTLNTNLANMVLEILRRRITGIYHLSGDTRTNKYAFSKLIAQVYDLDVNLIVPIFSNEISCIAKRPRDSSLNVEKARQMLNIKPLEIKQALKKAKLESKISGGDLND